MFMSERLTPTCQHKRQNESPPPAHHETTLTLLHKGCVNVHPPNARPLGPVAAGKKAYLTVIAFEGASAASDDSHPPRFQDDCRWQFAGWAHPLCHRALRASNHLTHR